MSFMKIAQQLDKYECFSHWFKPMKNLPDWINENEDLLFQKWSWERAKVAIQYLNNPYLEMDIMKPHRVLWADFFPVIDTGDRAKIIAFLETEWAIRTVKDEDEEVPT